MNTSPLCTIFKNIHSTKEPYYRTLDDLLERIKTGKSKEAVDAIRNSINKERAQELKKNLPSVCFSGKFKQRNEEGLIEHSGYICLDFDDVEDPDEKKSLICGNDYVFACWISPSGNGLKVLVKIANGKKHKEHFDALREEFPEIDKSGRDVSRVCYESYDSEIFLNREAKIFSKTKTITYDVKIENKLDEYENFKKLLVWLSNKGDAFVTGERNVFIFKLASACCRFGISQDACIGYCSDEFLIGEQSFSRIEMRQTIASAYKSNNQKSGSATFQKDILVAKTTRTEEKIDVDPDIFNPEIRAKDVIFGEDVKADALEIYDKGYDKVEGIGVAPVDELFKMKKGEITLLSGYGNQGKSTFLKWYLLMRVLLFEEKFALFSPEDNPAQEFYHDCVEVLAGHKLTPENPFRISRDVYDSFYDFISKHIFYVYPKDVDPKPDYIKERFLELIIKEKINGCIIDPFNQLTNDYGKSGGRSDKYLETFLADCSRFAQQNMVYFTIVAHPKMARKDESGNYPCPDVFDIADGAMWNNKMDNILIYHRPDHQINPTSTVCELHTKKIRRQRVVGKKGYTIGALHSGYRRFIFDGKDHMNEIMQKLGIHFSPKQGNIFNENDTPF